LNLISEQFPGKSLEISDSLAAALLELKDQYFKIRFLFNPKNPMQPQSHLFSK